MFAWTNARRDPAPGDGPLALFVAFLALASTAFAVQILNDGDTFWHIRAGEWMLDHRAILNFDPFSYTFAGKPWQTHEWLAEILLAASYHAGAWAAVVLLAAASFAATGAIIVWHLSRYLSRLPTLIAGVLALASVSGSLLARPHILALPLLAFWTASLADARARGRAPSLWLVPLMALWANLHASFIVGIVLAIALAVEAAISERNFDSLRAWALFIIASLAAALATPHGISGLLFPLQFNSLPALRFIGEWQPTGFTKLAPFEVAVAIALYVILTRRVQIGAVRAALLIGLTYLAFAHARHQMLLAVIAPMLLAEPMGAAAEEKSEAWLPASPVMASLLIAAMAGVVSLRLALPLPLNDGRAAPVTALARMPTGLRTEPVLNDYAFGGYLIFQNVRPFIDSRAELYGNEWLNGYAKLERGSAGSVKRTLDVHDVSWTILSSQNPLVRTMDALPGWKRIYADKWAVVHARTGAIARNAAFGTALSAASIP